MGGPGKEGFFSSFAFPFEIKGGLCSRKISCMGMAGAMLVVKEPCWLMKQQ